MLVNEFYEQEKIRWKLAFLKIIVITVVTLLSILIVVRFFTPKSSQWTDLVLLIIITGNIGLYVLATKGFVNVASAILVVLCLLSLNTITFLGKGIYDSALTGYMAIMIISYLLLGWRYSLLVLLTALAWFWVLGWMMIRGIYVSRGIDPVFIIARDASVILVIVSVLSHAYLRRMDKYITRLSEELAERKRTEQILLEKEENYRNMFEQASEGILIGSPGKDILMCNESMIKITGYARDEIIGENISFLFEDEELKKEPLRYDLLDEKQVVLRIRTLNRKDGIRVPVEMRTKKLSDGRYQAFFTDITRRLQAEKSLKDFERIFNMTANPICVMNEAGLFEQVNPAFENILGYQKSEILGKPFTLFIHPEDAAGTASYVNDMMSQHAAIISYENRYLTKQGATIWFSWVTQPVYSDNTSFSIAHDITHLKKIESELVEAKEKAEESDRLKTAFIENMSHEIRTPMNGIIGFSEILGNEDLNDTDRQHYLNIIVKSGQKLLEIIDDILDISAIETGQFEIIRERVNISELMTELYDFYYPAVKSRGLSLVLSHPKKKDLLAYTDRTRVYQVLSNLVSNAIKFTQEGSIELGYGVTGNHLEFSVKDTGIGVDPAQHEMIFERFWQAETRLTREHGGTGLGLAISRKLVELMGGRIGIYSQPGKGSTFIFILPHEPVMDTRDKKETETDTIRVNPAEKACILVAEDDETNYIYLETLLKKEGYRTMRAVTGVEAVELAASNEIDLVLMDIKMPGMDGWEATKKIKALRPRLPVIAQTAYAMPKDREKAKAAGCDAYIAKPILRNDLLQLMDEHFKIPE